MSAGVAVVHRSRTSFKTSLTPCSYVSKLPGSGRQGRGITDMATILRSRAVLVFVCFVIHFAQAQTEQPLVVPADSPRWLLEGKASVTEYQGRKCILLDGGGATVKDFE